MNESATAVEEVVDSKPSQPIAVKQLREFDARLLQQVPNLSKEQMQHLIEHPEELRARLHRYGLASMAQVRPQEAWGGNVRHGDRLSWENFYAELFNVKPDFSRIYLPNTVIYTYTTPIFVAPKLELKNILHAIHKLGVTYDDRAEIHHGVTDLRPDENYIASFSPVVLEEGAYYPSTDESSRAKQMTLREYLLWTAYCLHTRRGINFRQLDLHSEKIACSGALSFNFFSTRLNYFEESKFPSLSIDMDDNSKFTLYFRLGYNSGAAARRVKLWKSLPQI